VVFARTGTPEQGAKGVTAFFIPAGTAGLSTTRFDDLGSAIIGRGQVFLTMFAFQLATVWGMKVKALHK